MPLRVTSRFPTTVQIDGEPVKLSVKRMSPEEIVAFKRALELVGAPPEPPADETADARAARLEKHEADSRAFVRDSLAAYIEVLDDQIIDVDDEDERPITSGADLYRLYCGRNVLMLELLLMINAENTMNKREKEQFYEKQRRLDDGVPVAAESPVTLTDAAKANGGSSSATSPIH